MESTLTIRKTLRYFTRCLSGKDARLPLDDINCSQIHLQKECSDLCMTVVIRERNLPISAYSENTFKLFSPS
jgi:hypothetical protein